MHVAILGNGVAGTTAALRLRELDPDCRISLISGESRHPWSRPALMYVFMGHLRYADTKTHEDRIWSEQRIDLVRSWVTGIDLERRRLERHNEASLDWDRLLVATGSKPNRFDWPGQDLDGVQGLWGLPDLKRLYATCARTRRAVIVGGGLIGIELAEMLHSRGIHVTFLVRERSYWNNVLPREESAMLNEVIVSAGIDLRLETELAEIEDDGAGAVAGVRTTGGERLPCELVGLTAGVSPNLDVVRESGLPTGRGVLVDDTLRTPITDVFAAGDCAEIVTAGEGRNLIQQVWYTGKKQGRVAAENLAGGAVRYEPGVWYNSAKFLDLEYQTYGTVPPDAGPENSLWWRHPRELLGLRLLHEGGVFTGLNTLGMRLRHEVCEGWIVARRPLAYVLEHLEDAHFDPEFARRHTAAIRAALTPELPPTVADGVRA